MNKLIEELKKAIDSYVTRQVADVVKKHDADLQAIVKAIDVAQLAQQLEIKKLTDRIADIEKNYVRHE